MPLKVGDTVGLIAPSGCVPSDKLLPSISVLERFGLKVIVGESCTSSYGYLAGGDSVRAYDINNMFANPHIKGIFAIRGGYGASRIIDLLDYEMIKQNPKVFVGYSDITMLHCVFNQKCQFITYHAPMPSTELYKGWDGYTLDYYYRSLFRIDPLGKLSNPETQKFNVLQRGEGSGELIGGNLTVLLSTLGTKNEIDTAGKILFLEDIDEAPYRIDRMLVQLKQAGKLEVATGIILGGFTNCDAENIEKSLTLQQVFDEIFSTLSVPVITNVACGHVLPTMTLPLGARIRINTSEQEIVILD